MDESNKSLQAKLSRLNHQLDNYSSSVDEIKALKVVMQDILEDLETLSDTFDAQHIN